MMTAHREQHLEDGEVLRAIDEQLEPDESTRVRKHLASCDVCARRRQQLDTRQQRLAALLNDADLDMPTLSLPAPDNVIDIDVARARRREPRARHTWLRIAAGIVLLLGVALTMTPLQAIVASWIRAQWSRVVGEGQVVAPAPTPVAPPPQPGAVVTFAHSGARFQLNFAQAQAEGTVSVRATQDSEVSASASRAGVEMLLLPDGLRLVNDSASLASYELLVPPTVTDVTITIAGRVTARLDVARIAAGAVIPLR